MYDQILDNILNGTWPPGSKLPSENELCRLLGVSRVPIREAINKLNGMGILETRQGEGSRVMMMTPDRFMNSLLPMLAFNRKSMLDILEYRRIVEPENAALAARRADAADLARIRTAMVEMERIGRPVVEFAIADMKFHLEIARASKNTLLFNVANIIRDVLVSYYRLINEIMGTEKALIYHRNIYEAISRGDDRQARHWMSENLAVTVDEITRCYPAE